MPDHVDHDHDHDHDEEDELENEDIEERKNGLKSRERAKNGPMTLDRPAHGRIISDHGGGGPASVQGATRLNGNREKRAGSARG
jgi:hypothetical protein